jgi:PAS domain S-box-containing protein
MATETNSRIAGLALDAIQQTLLFDALDEGPALAFVADEEMTYLAVNQTACTTLGYSRLELLSLRVSDVAIDPDAEDTYRGMLTDRRAEGEALLRAKDGTVLRFTYKASEIKVGGLPYYVSVGFISG